MWVVFGIRRKYPREGVPEYPKRFGDGYRLVDPIHGSKKNRAEHKYPVESLDEAAHKIRKNGYHLWMEREDKRASLICPEHLIIDWRFAPLKVLKIKYHRLKKRLLENSTV